MRVDLCQRWECKCHGGDPDVAKCPESRKTNGKRDRLHTVILIDYARKTRHAAQPSLHELIGGSQEKDGGIGNRSNECTAKIVSKTEPPSCDQHFRSAQHRI